MQFPVSRELQRQGNTKAKIGTSLMKKKLMQVLLGSKRKKTIKIKHRERMKD